MYVNSEYIQKKEFHVVFKGYKPDEVDKFLDILSIEFDKLVKKNKELTENLDKLKFEGEKEEKDWKKIIQDALVSAHKVAEDVKSKAKIEADRILKEKSIKEEESIKDLHNKRKELEEKIEVIRSRYEEFKNKIRNLAGDLNEISNKMDKEGLGKIEITEPAITEETLKSYEKEEKPTPKEEDKLTRKEEELVIQDIFKGGKEKSKDKENKIEGSKKEESKIVDEGIKGDKKDSGNKNKDNELKRERKKIDIANPDIINNFFRTDED
jgi:cell division initiation protein